MDIRTYILEKWGRDEEGKRFYKDDYSIFGKASSRLRKAHDYVYGMNAIVSLGNMVQSMIGSVALWGHQLKKWRDRQRIRKNLSNLELKAGMLAEAVKNGQKQIREELEESFKIDSQVGIPPLRSAIAATLAITFNLTGVSSALDETFKNIFIRESTFKELKFILRIRDNVPHLEAYRKENIEKFSRNIDTYLVGMQGI